MTAQKEPPHYRGALAILAKRWLGSVVDRGSQRFLSVPYFGSKKFIYGAVFTYTSDVQTRVEFDTAAGKHLFRRIFITTGFPYVAFSQNARGVYKCLHIYAGRATLGKSNRLFLVQAGQTDEGFELCEIAAIVRPDTAMGIEELQARVSKLLELGGQVDNAEHAILDHALNAAESNADESIMQKLRSLRICLNARCLVNHRTSHKTLQQWVNIEKSQGRSQAVNGFVSDISRLTYPFALGRHGYNPSFANLNLEEVALELHEIMTHLSELGGKPFLNSGTLLGYYRDGRPIVHDDDFDLGIWLEGRTENEVFANWHHFVGRVKLHYTVINKGSFLSIKMSNGVQVDIFAAWTLRGKASVFPYCFEDCEDLALMPLGQLKVAGLDFAVPADPEALLAVNYGPNWRVPDPFWRFDYRKAKSRFGPAMKAMKVVFSQ